MLPGMQKSSALPTKFRAFHGVVGFVAEPWRRLVSQVPVIDRHMYTTYLLGRVCAIWPIAVTCEGLLAHGYFGAAASVGASRLRRLVWPGIAAAGVMLRVNPPTHFCGWESGRLDVGGRRRAL